MYLHAERCARKDQEMNLTEKDVLELRGLLADLTDLTIWMTGSADFGPEGQAHIGWVKGKPALDRALAYLGKLDDNA
jgi:hypothetical protein